MTSPGLAADSAAAICWIGGRMPAASTPAGQRVRHYLLDRSSSYLCFCSLCSLATFAGSSRLAARRWRDCRCRGTVLKPSLAGCSAPEAWGVSPMNSSQRGIISGAPGPCAAPPTKKMHTVPQPTVTCMQLLMTQVAVNLLHGMLFKRSLSAVPRPGSCLYRTRPCLQEPPRLAVKPARADCCAAEAAAVP